MMHNREWIIQLSQDGGQTWEDLGQVPWNTHVFQECRKYGTYREGQNLYRKVKR